MPGMSGRHVIQRRREIDPEVRVIVSSGHEVAEEIPPSPRSDHTLFVHKPCRVSELLPVVSSLLAT